MIKQTRNESREVPINWRSKWQTWAWNFWVQTWWRHQMETFSASLAICAGNSPVHGEFPHTKASDAELLCFRWSAWINGWANNREAGDLRRHCAHYVVTVMNNYWSTSWKIHYQGWVTKLNSLVLWFFHFFPELSKHWLHWLYSAVIFYRSHRSWYMPNMNVI